MSAGARAVRRGLERVSLTGPDDNTSVDALAELGRRYPFVEWALLYLPEKERLARNPTRAWRERFFDAGAAGGSAVHLCGLQAFAELKAGALPTDILQAGRLQLNINARGVVFSVSETLDLYRRALDLGPDLILQRHGGTTAAIELFLGHLAGDDRSRVHVLLDESKGRGVKPDAWTMPKGLGSAFLGFAGGISPGNVATVARAVDELSVAYWLDMESGVRTENEFDISKAKAVLETVAEFVAS
ncbi:MULTISPECIES: hypothetical protein [unclassified Variovorax]|uniref:phosphoribosylanthranilate isomerase n=1 Tax=unclassified Variovorax TaxID=663243 RepID=UPI000837F575|nr:MULTISPECIES: hypothetical protein [unclassified Variovorax]PNG50505.1 N-(5'-phosphoribosyl)anthranilate isomerase [Variovorax sp. B2]PNG51378.1 N-(5'-phosphoribosyl)anthranilate isomerase [Variovorax sp. B4]VTV17654.1 N-(5'-phosphoribosyl)anthranilate isomerase [Variovorax sp. WDL1]